MKNNKDLEKELQRIDGRGYKAYKDITGEYLYHDYVLSVDYVQSDPFAPPSRVRVILSQEKAQFPCNLFDEPHKKITVIDFLTRLFVNNTDLYYKKIGGSSKSGLLSIGKFRLPGTVGGRESNQ
ncbi:Predicted ATPase of the ABC class [Anaerovirgula multivorans]|uniref:Predicted ATPase of the ABC class n=1 Tax=Anaerovirgula multivorans TaxID=312168 RepID=A0A239BA59_9FIRM|nr:ABC-ATPase domain-containing protein [Anaerovirgula multivorans]SNS04288.1 Predicted ATPase of the ABC class [Anaerovirgula multivorans]